MTRGTGLLEGLLHRWRIRAMRRALPSDRGRMALDLGCGDGSHLCGGQWFSHCVGIDPVARPYETVSAAGHAIRVVRGDASDSAVVERALGAYRPSVVTALAVIEHMDARSAARMLTVARTSAAEPRTLVVTTPSRWTQRLLRIMALLGLVSREEIEEHVHQYTPAELRLLLTLAGWNNVRVARFMLGANLIATAE